MSAMTTLAAARDALAVISGVNSCAIGLEANIGPADYPLIRLVPSRLTPGKPYSGRTVEVLVYFGHATTLSEGLETVYANLFALESSIRSVIHNLGHRYVETITDEDRLDAYKLMACRVDMVAPD